MVQEVPDMGYEWRNWHMDHPELKGGDAAEVGVWKKLASRATGSYSLTSDDPSGIANRVPVSRVARPQDASKALYLVSLLSSSARSYLDTYEQRTFRPVAEVADMETRLGPVVFVDPVFQHSRCHYVGFVRGWFRRVG